mgnify:CR=1 FL=1
MNIPDYSDKHPLDENQAFTTASNSSGVTSDCSPVVIFFKSQFPFVHFIFTNNSDKKEICLSLAYPICFFILEASG